MTGLSNSGKRCDSRKMKDTNQGGKRLRSIKAASEYSIHDDAVKCPNVLTKDDVLKRESSI